MFKISELRKKDVINEKEGSKLGYAYDIDIDVEKGAIQSIIIPGESRFLGIFVRSEETVIPWDRIRQIGVDVIIIGDDIPKIQENKKTALPNSNLLREGRSFDWDDWEI